MLVPILPFLKVFYNIYIIANSDKKNLLAELMFPVPLYTSGCLWYNLYPSLISITFWLNWNSVRYLLCFRIARILVALEGLFHALGRCGLPQSIPQNENGANPRTLTWSQNWPHMIRNNLLNYLSSSSRMLEALAPRKHMWKAQIKNMC